jgi:hypothetical protein
LFESAEFAGIVPLVEGSDMCVEENRDFQHLMQIFFLGELVGLPTLSSILTKFDITSNLRQIKYKQLCKRLTLSKIRKMYECVFEYEVKSILESMSQKDSSCWSKEIVTVVLDDSIFKQWLGQSVSEKGLDSYYGRFFSGQFKTCVYGYKVLTLGVSIDGVLYPLYFDFIGKSTEERPAEKSTVVAQKLVKRWGKLMESIKKGGHTLPNFHLSCDSGYNDKLLNEVCQQNGLIYISVPIKSHFIEVSGQKWKISEWIKEEFTNIEKAHHESEKDLPNDKKTPFVHRFRAQYVAQQREVTFLAFRLNGSKKVSVIYTDDRNIFAKTLRRHWFARTYIEQFFKLLKHVLKIQEARTTNKEDFENKLLKMAFMACHAQKLVKYLRGKISQFAKKGFIAIQRILCSDIDFLNLLHEKITVRC